MATNNTTPNNNKSDNSETAKSIIYFIIALLVFILFKPTFEGLYQSVFIELFKDLDIEPSINLSNRGFWVIFSVLIINFFGIGYLIWLFCKDYIFPTNTYRIGLYFFLLYFFYRCIEPNFSPTYIFFPVSCFFKFADFIFIYFILFFLLFYFNDLIDIGKNSYNKFIRYTFNSIQVIIDFFTIKLPEPPIGIYKNDLPTNTDTLDRNHASDYLATNILENHSEKALAIGIMGTWGTGKTTFLELVKNSLYEKSKEKAYKSQKLIMIDFNAWFSKKSDQIVQDFFDVLKNKIGEYSGELSDEITSYAQKLVTSKEGIIISILKEVFSIFASKETPAELYEKINTILQKINFKVVIFIDDLDRLDKKEIVEVLRIIRNTANFHNTVFIVAYDRNYVINAIKDINDHNKESYLEKIFQLEIALPYTEKKTIINQLQEWLEIWIKSNIATDLQEDLIERQYGLKQIFINRDKIVNDFITTMRDASRFYNLFILGIKFEMKFEKFKKRLNDVIFYLYF